MLHINSPEVLLVPVEDCREPLTSLVGLSRLRFRAPLSWRNTSRESVRLLARTAVKERLSAALNALPSGTALELACGFRPIEHQRRKFEASLNRCLRDDPSLTTSEARALTARYVADPDLFAPHATGGALDVALVDRRGHYLDVGDRSPGPGARMDAEGLTCEQRDNRAALAGAMTAAGFVNYPLEWWHWSYGERFWGCISGRVAIYDTTELREGRGSTWLRTVHWLFHRYAYRMRRPRSLAGREGATATRPWTG